MCLKHNADPKPAWVTVCYPNGLFPNCYPINLPDFLIFLFVWTGLTNEILWMTLEWLQNWWHSLNSKSIYFEVKSEILSKCQHALLIYVYVMISTILTLLLKNIWTWSVLSFTHLSMEKKRVNAKCFKLSTGPTLNRKWPNWHRK